MADTRLFSPIQVGAFQLAHRVVLAPLTRNRCPGHLVGEHAAVYYAQRASQGGLLITEATYMRVNTAKHVYGLTNK